MKRIYFTVTNDLSYDQRMHRICSSLSAAGYEVVLVGRKRKNSPPLQEKPFQQKRLHGIFNKGPLFYAEYNLRLFFFLLFRKMDAVCAIDLDTILPCLFISSLKRVRRIYDAHEYFTELKEVRTRPVVKKAWTMIEKFSVPRFEHGYTVSPGLVEQFQRAYGRNYSLIRNLPVLRALQAVQKKEKFLLYQGAVNEGRGFEYLIPAMERIRCRLVVCGDGNFMPQLKSLIARHRLESKVELKGMLLPQDLFPIAREATIGIGLAEKEGLNQFYALPNKFLDYIHAGLPQVAMAYPEYERINAQFQVAVLLEELSAEKIADTVNALLDDREKLERMQSNCLVARELLCWQHEEKVLIGFYKHLFQN